VFAPPRSVTPTAEIVLVDRDKPETKDFTLHDVPEGKDVTYPSAPTSVADALGYLNLEDGRRRRAKWT